MKLLLVISSLGPGGAERVLTGLADHWADQGHDVTLATLSGEEDVPFYPLNVRVNLMRLGVMSSVAEGPLRRLVSIVRRILTLRKTVKRIGPDRVVSFVDITNLTTLLACMGAGVPVIVSERIDPHHHDIPLVYKVLRRLIYMRASRVVVQTSSAACYFPFPVCVIPNFVRPTDDCVTVRPEVRQIVSVGRLSPQKDFQTLIMAFAKVYRHYPHMSLIIYGQGPEREKLEALIDRQGLSHCVVLPGAVASVEAKMLEADLFVFPSLYEGFPNALCEAMAVGMPVLASRCSGNVDVVREGIDGLLFPIGNVEALYSSMMDLIRNQEKRQQLSGHARTIADRFNDRKILDLWDQTLNPSA